MEGLFEGNIPILYFIAVLYILLLDKLKLNQKILIVYIFSYIIKACNILSTTNLLIVSNIDFFIYLEYLTDDEVKTDIISNFIYRIVDYLYKMIFEYSLLYFVLALFVNTAYFKDCCNAIFSFILPNADCTLYCNGFIYSIYFILIIISVTFLSMESYSTNTFTYMKRKLDNVTSWTTLEIDDITRDKLYMLSSIEDKSFFVRDNSYSFFSIGFIKYKFNNFKNAIVYLNNKSKLKNNFFRKIKKAIKFIYSKIKKLKHIKRYIRGYSTIEMQLIRTIGVKKGYEKLFYRKIYEVVYSKIFFGSYRKYCNDNKYKVKCSYKEYLIYCYINIADIKINGVTYSNMIKAWDKDSIEDVSLEEFLISILGLSWRKINEDILNNYSITIKNFDIQEEELKNNINQISSKAQG